MNILRRLCPGLLCLAILAATAAPSLSFQVHGAGEEGIPSSYEGGMPAELTSYATPEERAAAMEIVAEDEEAVLYYDPATAQAAVRSKADGLLYFTSPYNIADAAAEDSVKERLSASIRLLYYDKSLQPHELNSFTDAAAFGQIRSEAIEGGVAAVLTIGQTEQRLLLPEALPQESYDAYIAANLDGQALRRVKAFYRLYNLENYDDELIRAELLAQFPGLASGPIYAKKDTTAAVSEELAGYFQTAGYTFEQMEKDQQAVFGESVEEPEEEEEEEEARPQFQMRLEYTLEDGQLVVRLPAESISYDTSLFTLHKIWILEYFGAASGTEEGYLFLPDGSGALLEYSDEAGASGNVVSARIYGPDTAIRFERSDYLKKTMRLPVFGAKTGAGAFLGIVEEGDSIGELYGLIREVDSLYHKVGAAFHYNASDSFNYNETTGGGVKTTLINRVDKNPYTGNMTIRYVFLSGAQADYSGMAGAYRTYLKQRGQLPDKPADALTLYYGALGALDKEDSFLFIPITRLAAMTSFSDMEAIARELTDAGVSDLAIRYFGWANGGLSFSVMNKAKPVGSLGGSRGLEALSAYAQEAGIGLFPEAEFTFVRRDGWFDGYQEKRDSARQLNDTYARIYPIDYGASMERLDEALLMLKPAVMQSNLRSFLKSLGKMELKIGLSAGSLGSDLHADYNQKNPVNRAQSEEILIDMLKTASESHELMLDGGNAFALPYASHLLNVDSTSSALVQEAASVPFIQMVLHGSLPYAGTPVNLSSDAKKATLKAIENGESLYFLLASQESDALADSPFADYFSVDYSRWKELLPSLYREVSEVLDGTYGRSIERHDYLSDDVVRVTYEGGKRVYVNYGDTAFAADGLTIAPQSAAAQ